jgi:hypothetical protein
MPWPNPYAQVISEVITLTQPPADVALDPDRSSLAVGLLMRSRRLLIAQALVSDRILAGTTEPLLRAILEACFTGGWLLADEQSLDLYVGYHRKKWRIIAQDQQSRAEASGGKVHAELAPFLDRTSEDLPPESELPTFEDRARIAGLDGFYPVYRIVSRRAHPDFLAAMSGLRSRGDRMYQPNTSPIAAELGDTYINTAVYVLARFGAQVDDALGWGKAAELQDLAAGLVAEAAAEAASAAEDAELSDEDGQPDPP